MSSRKALGKGLGALIPGAEPGAARPAASKPNTLGIEEICPSRFQPRVVFDDELLEELAESVRRQGIIEPLIVRPSPDGADAPYELVAGERRWRAAQKAGLDRVPAIVKEFSDREALEAAITENLQRENFNPIEEARAYRMLIDGFELTQEDAAARVGVERSTVANALRLLKLESEIQEDIIWGKLTAGHARALLQVEGKHRRDLRRKIIDKALSVREAESLARKMAGGETAEKRTTGRTDSKTDSALRSMEERLTRSLGTKVFIRLSKRGGRVEIRFADEDQLEGICHRLME